MSAENALTVTIPVGEHAIVGAWTNTVGPAHAVVVVAPAMAVPARWYAPFAAHLAERGLDVLRFDYWGFGASVPPAVPGAPVADHPATAQDWGDDLGAAIALARAHAGDRPVVLVTHSFGGQALGLTDQGAALDGLFCVASQFGVPALWSGWQRWRMALIMRGLFPALARAFGHVPAWGGLGAAVPGGVVAEWTRWASHPDYHLGAVPGVAENYRQVRCPARVVGIADDPLAPPRAVAALARCVPGAHHETVHPEDHGLARLGHFGWFRPPARALWDELADWVGRISAGGEPVRWSAGS